MVGVFRVRATAQCFIHSMVRGKGSSTGVLNGVGARRVEGRLQLFMHQVSGCVLAVLGVFLITGVIFGIWLEILLEIDVGTPSAAKTNDVAKFSIPIDILPLRRNMTNARCMIFSGPDW